MATIAGTWDKSNRFQTHTFTKKLAQMKGSAEDELHGAVNLTADNGVEFGVCLSTAETETTTWRTDDTDHIANHLGRGIYEITSNEQILRN